MGTLIVSVSCLKNQPIFYNLNGSSSTCILCVINFNCIHLLCDSVFVCSVPLFRVDFYGYFGKDKVKSTFPELFIRIVEYQITVYFRIMFEILKLIVGNNLALSYEVCWTYCDGHKIMLNFQKPVFAATKNKF